MLEIAEFPEVMSHLHVHKLLCNPLLILIITLLLHARKLPILTVVVGGSFSMLLVTLTQQPYQPEPPQLP